MTPGDLLLGWASCHRELRVARVQAAALRLCPPPVEYGDDDPRRARYLKQAKRLAWNLRRLAHVESHGRDRFRVVPPTIVSTEHGQRHLVGARDEDLIDRLAKVAPGGFRRETQIDAPSVLSFEADDETAAGIAAQLGITHVHDRGRDVLAILPPLSGLLPGALRESLPEKCERRERSGSGDRFGRWRQVKPGFGEPGLYRTVNKRRDWYLVPDDGGLSMRLDTPERRAAAAWSLARDKMLRLRRGSRELRIPAMPFGLPLLVDRALILASGRLPLFDQQGWTYSNIDPERARQVARVAGARLEETE